MVFKITILCSTMKKKTHNNEVPLLEYKKEKLCI